ncbi:hypothetical protein LP422_08550 [Janibacter limosus]|uniref:Uncharacterized protein n=1 Tax=Janibacter limosus TaxID=53458 RepID=A0AC61U7J3_9MICO|nr:hypothetical protein [Janibacter limosus]UUZ45914.1 hypothetical protein LP422_08550 [Janibacter limosus]
MPASDPTWISSSTSPTRPRSSTRSVCGSLLRDLLEVEVDVVGSDSLRGDVRDRILHEAIPL